MECSAHAGTIIGDGDRNEMPFLLVGLSPCVVPKNLFLELSACAHACKWPGSRVEKLNFFSTRSKWRPHFKILPGNISSVPTFKEFDSHNEEVTIERRRGKLE